MDGVNSQHRIALSLEANTLVLASDSAAIKYSDITSIEMRWRFVDTKTKTEQNKHMYVQHATFDQS